MAGYGLGKCASPTVRNLVSMEFRSLQHSANLSHKQESSLDEFYNKNSESLEGTFVPVVMVLIAC